MSDVEFKMLVKELAGKQRQTSSILLLSVITLIAVILTWATVTELDNVTRGSGKTVSEDSNQLVQSSEPGVLKKRYVNDGDSVKQGDILFDIDPIDAKTQLDQAEQRMTTLKIKARRLNAEVAGKILRFDDELMINAPTSVSTELALFRARRDDLSTKSSILDQRRIQRLNEVKELQINFETAQNSLQLINREIANVEPLVKSGLAPETRLISLQREAAAAEGKASSAQSAQMRIKSGLEEIDQQLKAEQQAYVTSALTDLSSIEGEMAELDARIPALTDRVERTSIRSPIDGVINRINYSSEDAYVRSGDVLLEIVPSGTELIVETKIDPKDIAEIALGSDVKISLTAFDASRYGNIEGHVLNISADAVSEPETGAQYYIVDVSIDGTLYESDGSEVTILPGMVASIDVLTGKRTILDYFWEPISKTKERAFRD
ncbi:HlyD family type I secretion periplasmic adaptor subunit [Paracoccaceae bacterium]|nr:HlyD family type I secretion periplasmic adaptor subunit [Paracoccaceae bacterium]